MNLCNKTVYKEGGVKKSQNLSTWFMEAPNDDVSKKGYFGTIATIKNTLPLNLTWIFFSRLIIVFVRVRYIFYLYTKIFVKNFVQSLNKC